MDSMDNTDNADDADNADNAENVDNAGNLYDTDNLEKYFTMDLFYNEAFLSLKPVFEEAFL